MTHTFNWYVYLCYNKLYYTITLHFPYEHLAKYGKVKLFDHHTSKIHGGVIVKPRNIYFVLIKLTRNQVNAFVAILNNIDWVKHSLCNIDINNYPELLI